MMVMTEFFKIIEIVSEWDYLQWYIISLSKANATLTFRRTSFLMRQHFNFPTDSL
jgi:hypothetical protein